MALFQNLFGGGQQPGMQQPVGMQQPMLPRVPWGQNPMITTAALSLLGGRNLNEGLANVAATAPAGMAAKSGMQQFMLAQQDAQAKKAEAEARKAQMNDVMKAWPGLSPEQRALFSVQPELFGQYAMSTMEAPKPTDDMREYDLAKSQGFDGTFQDYMTSMKRAGATNINNNVGGTNKYAETVDTGIANDFLTIQQEGRKATDTKTALTAMERSMSDPNFYSGAGGETVAGLKKLIVLFGGDPSQAASTETFNALAKQAALENMGGSLGSGFSNADRDFVTGQVPALGNTPEGNKALIEINKKMAERKEQVAKMARDYATRNGGRIDYAFYDQLAQWAEANPLFPQQQGQAAPGAGGGQGAPQIPQMDVGGSVTLPDGTVIERVE